MPEKKDFFRMDKTNSIPWDEIQHSKTALTPVPLFFRSVHKFIEGDTHEVPVYYFQSDIYRVSGDTNGVVPG